MIGILCVVQDTRIRNCEGLSVTHGLRECLTLRELIPPMIYSRSDVYSLCTEYILMSSKDHTPTHPSIHPSLARPP